MFYRATLIVAVTLAGQASKDPKPPKVEYNKVRDVTYYSTGSIKTEGRARYDAYFSFPGKVPVRAKEATLDFLTYHNPKVNENDRDVMEWEGVKEVTFNINGKVTTYPAECTSWIDKDQTRQMLVGRTVVEQVRVNVPFKKFLTMGGYDVLFEIGRTQGAIKGKGRTPLIKLVDAAIPLPGGDE